MLTPKICSQFKKMPDRQTIKSSVADTVQFFSDLDPDPTYIDMFLMFSKKMNIFLCTFLIKCEHLMPLKIKMTNYFDETKVR